MESGVILGDLLDDFRLQKLLQHFRLAQQSHGELVLCQSWARRGHAGEVLALVEPLHHLVQIGVAHGDAESDEELVDLRIGEGLGLHGGDRRRRLRPLDGVDAGVGLEVERGDLHGVVAEDAAGEEQLEVVLGGETLAELEGALADVADGVEAVREVHLDLGPLLGVGSSDAAHEIEGHLDLML